MRSIVAKLALSSLAVLPVACGGTPPPGPTTPATPVATSTTPVIATAPPADLSPAAEPEGTFAVIRWRAPSRTFSAVRDIMGLEVPVEELVDEVLRARTATPLIAMDAPVDAVFALDPNAPDTKPMPLAAFSIGLRSLEEARTGLNKGKASDELAPGVFRVDAGRRNGLVCVIGASVGPAPARLVCGDREKEVLSLQPYLSRGLPSVAMPDKDLWAEVRFAPVQRKFGAQLPGYLTWAANFASYQIGTGDRKLDGAIKQAMGGIATETVSLANDLDKLTLFVDVNGASQAAEAEVALKLKGRESWFTQRFFEKAGEAGPAPAIFWRAPVDSESVIYGRGGDPKAWAAVRKSSGDLLDGLTSQVEFPAAERKKARDLVERLFASSPVSVTASGKVDLPAPAGRGDKAEEIRNAVISTIGWQVWGMEESSGRLQDWIKDLAALYNKPAVKAWITKKGHVEAKYLPTAKVTPFGKGLDKDTRALEVAFAIPSGRAAKAPPPIPFYIVVMPDGPRTWMAFGSDKASLEKHLAMVKTGSPDTQTIASRPGLEVFKSGRAVSGGYMTMAGLVQSASGGLTKALDPHGGAMDPVVAALPRTLNKGQTPILFETTAQSGNPSSELVFKFRSSKGTLEDLKALVHAMGFQGGRP